MATLRKISREDIVLKARLISEGVRYDSPLLPKINLGMDPIEKELPEKLNLDDMDGILALLAKSENIAATNNALGNEVKLNESRIPAPIFLNPKSKIEAIVENGKVIFSEDGKMLGTGVLKIPGASWADKPMSNGVPARAMLPGMSAGIINALFSLSCNNVNTGRGCKYCGLFTNPVSRKINQLPIESLKKHSKFQAEAIKMATDNGWRGSVAMTGGAFPRSVRKEYIDRLEIAVGAIREAVGEKVFSELHFVYNHYPPENFSDMHIWKKIGIKGTSFDIEVMNAKRFSEICPGKHAYKPLEYWKEAQEASVEVFGPIINTITCVVVGIEEASSLIEGVDERLGKGVMPIPLTFVASPDSDSEGLATPGAEWILEVSDRLAELYLKHSVGFVRASFGLVGKMLLGKKGLAPKRGPRSVSISIVFDEIYRRLQNKSPIELLGLLKNRN